MLCTLNQQAFHVLLVVLVCPYLTNGEIVALHCHAPVYALEAISTIAGATKVPVLIMDVVEDAPPWNRQSTNETLLIIACPFLPLPWQAYIVTSTVQQSQSHLVHNGGHNPTTCSIHAVGSYLDLTTVIPEICLVPMRPNFVQFLKFVFETLPSNTFITALVNDRQLQPAMMVARDVVAAWPDIETLGSSDTNGIAILPVNDPIEANLRHISDNPTYIILLAEESEQRTRLLDVIITSTSSR